MQTPPQFSADTGNKLLQLLKQSKTSSEARRIQCILFAVQKIKTSTICKMVGFTEDYIRRVWVRYRKEGEHFLLGERRGNGRGKANLSTEEEINFLEPFIETAKSSGMLIVSDVHRALAEKLGREKLHHSITYNLLHRHDWRKIVPRPQHPKAKEEAREAFKASFPPEDSRGKKGSGTKKS